jgi:hypothetical protein
VRAWDYLAFVLLFSPLQNHSSVLHGKSAHVAGSFYLLFATPGRGHNHLFPTSNESLLENEANTQLRELREKEVSVIVTKHLDPIIPKGSCSF